MALDHHRQHRPSRRARSREPDRDRCRARRTRPRAASKSRRFAREMPQRRLQHAGARALRFAPPARPQPPCASRLANSVRAQRAFSIPAEGLHAMLWSNSRSRNNDVKTSYIEYISRAGFGARRSHASSHAAPRQPSSPFADFVSFINDDQHFRPAARGRAAINDAGRAAQLASMIPDYPAPCYLEYFHDQAAALRLGQATRASTHPTSRCSSLPAAAYDGQAIADRAAQRLSHGAGRDATTGATSSQQYSRFVLNDDTQVKCYALESRSSRAARMSRTRRARCSSIRNGTATAVSI